MNRQIEVMVIGRPSRFRDSLYLLLTSMSQIEKIHLAGDIVSAIKQNQPPAILVLDAAAGCGQPSALIKKLRITWPLTGLVVLVENEQEFQAVVTVASAVPLLKGFPAARLIEAVESLLSK